MAYEPHGLDIVLNFFNETIGLQVYTDDVCALLCAPFFATPSSRLSPGLKLFARCMAAVCGPRVPVATVTKYLFCTPDGRPRTVMLRSSCVPMGATHGRDDVLRVVTLLGRGFNGRLHKAFAGFDGNAVPGCLALALAKGLGTGETIEDKIRSIGLQFVDVDRNG